MREVSSIHFCRLGAVWEGGQEGRLCGLGHVVGASTRRVEDSCWGQMWGTEYEDQVGVGPVEKGT